jgi:hypothetical protein
VATKECSTIRVALPRAERVPPLIVRAATSDRSARSAAFSHYSGRSELLQIKFGRRLQCFSIWHMIDRTLKSLLFSGLARNGFSLRQASVIDSPVKTGAAGQDTA